MGYMHTECNSNVWGVQQLLACASLQCKCIEKPALMCLVWSEVGCVVPCGRVVTFEGCTCGVPMSGVGSAQRSLRTPSLGSGRTTQGPSNLQSKVIFGRFRQLFPINAHEMAPRTTLGYPHEGSSVVTRKRSGMME